MLAHESRSWRGAFRAREVSERRTVSRGWLVELVRLLFVVLFAAAGYTLATRLGSTTPSRTVIGVALGSATGFVLGGVLGRQTYAAVRSMERDLRKVPAAEVVAGAGGLIAGLAVAALLSVPIFRLPPLAAWTSVAFMYATLGFVGYRAGRTKHEDLFALIGMKPRTAGTSGKVFVDTRAHRQADLDLVATASPATCWFLGGARELQAIADSSTQAPRSRAIAA
jgi:uncharacterized protein YacL